MTFHSTEGIKIQVFGNLSFLGNYKNIDKDNNYTKFFMAPSNIGIKISNPLPNGTMASILYEIGVVGNNPQGLQFYIRQGFLELDSQNLGSIKIGNFISPFSKNILNITDKIIQGDYLDAGIRAYYAPSRDHNILLFKNAINYSVDLYQNVNWETAYQRENKDYNLKI